MYSLPTIKPKTLPDVEKPTICTDLYGCAEDGPSGPGSPSDGTGGGGSGGGTGKVSPRKLKSALRLAQMSLNHFSLIISGNRKNLAVWGPCDYGNVGPNFSIKVPQTVTINWDGGTSKNIFNVITTGTVPSPTEVVTSWGANGFTIFKTDDHDLYGTGSNSNYILNRTDTGISNVYNLISKNVVSYCVAFTGFSYMLYVKSNSKVYGLGPGNYGFGKGDPLTNLTVDDATESNYLGISGASEVFCANPSGLAKSFILKMDGTVLASGYNTDGCLGVNSNDSIIKTWQFVKTSYDGGTTFVNLTGVIDIVTSNYVLVGGANTTDPSATTWTGGKGSTHMSTYFLTEDGSVYTCGNNKFGQLGLDLSASEIRKYADKTNITKASDICTTAGGTSVLVTTTDDEVYTWGNNQWGQLGTGDTANKNKPNLISIPRKKIKMIHGGGMYGVINGAFLVVFGDGDLYGAGFNATYALGITNSGVPNPGPITTFTRNEYFGVGPTQNQDPQRYPLSGFSGLVTRNSDTITNAQIYKDKVVYGKTLSIYVLKGMIVSGTGIPANTKVIAVNYEKNEITLSNTATLTINTSDLRYDVVIKTYQADLCGYGTEMAQKVVTEDGTLYMSGWNQKIADNYNFNYYIGTENVSTPTFFDAIFS